jgi:hypothetical protein
MSELLSKSHGIWLHHFGRKFMIEGGPYMKRPTHRTFGVNVAAEINTPSDVKVNVRDFSIPKGPIAKSYWLKAATKGLRAALRGEDVYVGCFGGIGRTGMMLATMAKITGETYPISHVRESYDEHAVETTEQMAFIDGLDVRPSRRTLKRRRLIRRLSLGLIGW